MFRLLFLFLFSLATSYSQVGTGEWRLHVPNRKALDVVNSNNQIYCAFENGLLEHDPNASESRLWTAVNGLSDLKLTAIGQYSSRGSVFVGYANGNIDKIENNRVINIPAIRLAEIQGDKKINRFYSHGTYVYVATGFGIVKIDPIKNEVKDTYYPTHKNATVNDIVIVGDTLFALTANCLRKGLLSNIALADPSSWETDSRLKELPTEENSYTHLRALDQNLFVLKQNEKYGLDSVFQIRYEGNKFFYSGSFDLQINSLNNTSDRLIMNTEGAIYIYKSDLTEDFVRSAYNLGAWISPYGTTIVSKDELWIADGQFGLRKVFGPYNIYNQSFDGPAKSEFYRMDWLNGRLVVAAGGLSGKSVTFNTAGIYVLQGEKWTSKDRYNSDLWLGKNIWDYICASIDPTDKNTIAIGTYSEIPLSIMRSGEVVTDTFTYSNSTLKNAYGGPWSLVSSLQYDLGGNLWVLNGYSDRPLNVYTKDKKWLSFECGTEAKNKFSGKLVIDNNGNKWFALDNTGLFGYNDNQTVSDPTDDKYIYLNTGKFSGDLPSDRVTALAVDFDNEIWIGTDNGFAVLYNTSGAFDASAGDYNVSRIKLEYEGNVEYVLGNTSITDIEVDGGNRKWIGTANSGIVLLSADGLEIVQQFTVDNSPLISNNILDMEIDHNTGELFIITDLGLISYRTDASFGDPEYSDVTVFPNPARPDFNGVITIQGIQFDSDVKITDAAGNLVYKTTSNGGTATWNGKTLTGERVRSGVYLIWTAANEGKGRKVGKVLVVN